MEGWKSGKVEESKGLRVEGWKMKIGILEKWKNGTIEWWKNGQDKSAVGSRQFAKDKEKHAVVVVIGLHF